MGVLDLLRRRSRDDAASTPEASEAAPEFAASVDSAPEMRGDFMLLPPLRPTFGNPTRIQHTLDEFLVTHRPTAVTNEPLAHDIDTQRLGMVRGSARRSTRARPARDLLVHRREAETEVEDLEFDEPAQQLPAPTSPRRLKASATRSAPPITAGELPTVAAVHRSVSAPSINARTSFSPDREEELSAVREASRAENSTEAPVMRRRGGMALPETAAPIPPTAPPMMGDDDVIDLETLEAPSAADIPPLTGGTRVRGAQPPGAIPPSRPLIGSQPDDRSSEQASPASAPAAMPEELVHRVPESVETESPVPAPTQTSMPSASAGTTSPMSAMPAGGSVALSAAASSIAAVEPTRASSSASLPQSPSTEGNSGDVRAADVMTASATPTVTRSSRSLLGDRAPMIGPAASAATESSVKPGASGRTGVQRKARPESSAAPSLPVATAAPIARAATSSAFSGTGPQSQGDSAQSAPAQSAPASNGRTPDPVPTIPAATVAGAISSSATEQDTPAPPVSAGTHADPTSGQAATLPATAARASVNSTEATAPSELTPRGAVPPSLVPGAMPAITPPSAMPPTTPSSAAPNVSEPPAPAPRTIDVPPEVRKAVAAATGQAPDSVTVHEGAHADAESQALNAEAFTRDGEIYLAGDASLDSPRGQALLAHELTHVVQQRGGSERMPDESTREGIAHEEAALKVERAMAKESDAPTPASLEHARGAEPSGAAPANVEQGVQRRGKEIGPYGSINRDDDDDDATIGMPAQPEPAVAHASVQQPSVLEQVDLIHAGQAPPVREESDDSDSDSDSGRSDYQDVEGDTFTSLPDKQLARRAPGRGAKAMTVFERMMQSPAAPKPKTKRAGGGSSPKAPATRSAPTSTSGPSDVGESGGAGDADSTGQQPRPEPGPKEKALDYFSRMMQSPEAPAEPEAIDDRRGALERQADTLYPYLRSRLRAELVRDRERRGRLARDWR